MKHVEISPDWKALTQRQFARLWAHNTTTEIARMFGVSRQSVSARAKKFGLPHHRFGRSPVIDVERARALYEGGMTQDQVALALNVSQSAISKLSVSHAWQKPRSEPEPEPEDNEPMPGPRLHLVASQPESAKAAPTSERFTPDMDSAIRRTGGRYRALAELADRYGLTLRTIQARWHAVR